MLALVTEATMSDGMPFPFSPLLNVQLEDGRTFNDLTPAQLRSLALREGWQVQPQPSA